MPEKDPDMIFINALNKTVQNLGRKYSTQERDKLKMLEVLVSATLEEVISVRKFEKTAPKVIERLVQGGREVEASMQRAQKFRIKTCYARLSSLFSK